MLYCPAYAFALIGDTEGAFGLDGSIRTMPMLIDYSKLPSFYRPGTEHDHPVQSLLRLTAAGRPAEDLVYEVHLVQDYDSPPPQSFGDYTSASSQNRYRAVDASREWHSGSNAAGFMLDRLNVKYSFSSSDLTVGRQAITFGKAYFWNPLDVFFHFAPQQFDRDYKPGVDAVRFDMPFGNFSGINLVGAAGPEIDPPWQSSNDETWASSWYGSALIGRFYATMSDWDLAAQCGKIYGGWQVGGGAVGEIGPLEFRLEAAWFKASKNISMPDPYRGYLLEDHWTIVAGTGRRFENTFNFEAEYLYNGAGDSDNLEESLLRYTYGPSLHLSRHLLGVLFSYDFVPIIIGQLVWVYSISDRSSLIQPALFISIADEAELIMGATISTGDRPWLHTETSGMLQIETPRLESEFGSYPNIYFIKFKFYF